MIAGVSGGDAGVRGFLDAYRPATGERVWRFWTVPAPGEPGSETWGGKAITHGCAATWLTGTYDPDARLLYWPTGNPCPDYNGTERKGDNLYSNSILALNPDTGRLRWHFQFTPHDVNDWDATETPVLVDAVFRGQPRKLLLHGDRNGFFYVLDRLTGEFLLAEPFIKTLTWATGIDAKGRPILAPNQEPTPGRHPDLSCRDRRDELAVAVVQPGHGPLLSDGGGVLQRLHEKRRVVHPGPVVLRRRHASLARRCEHKVRARDRHPDRQGRVGDSGTERRRHRQRPDDDRGRADLLRRFGGRMRSSRPTRRPASCCGISIPVSAGKRGR